MEEYRGGLLVALAWWGLAAEGLVGETPVLVQPHAWLLGSKVEGGIVSVRIGTLGHGEGWWHYGHGEGGWAVVVDVCGWKGRSVLRLRTTALLRDDLGDKDDWQPWDVCVLAPQSFWGFLGDAAAPFSASAHSDRPHRVQSFDL